MIGFNKVDKAALAEVEAKAAAIRDGLLRLDKDDFDHPFDNARTSANQKQRAILRAEEQANEERRACILAGVEPEPPKSKAPALPRPPLPSTRAATRPIVINVPIVKRDDLVSMGKRSVDEIFDLVEVEERFAEHAMDKIADVFAAFRKQSGSNDPVYRFDGATWSGIQSCFAALLASAEQNKYLSGILRRELEVKLSERINALQKRIDEMSNAGLEYMGVYQRAMAYRRGHAVTHDGSLWIANKTTLLPPASPEGKDDWTLAVKRGRDGKESAR